MVFEVFPDDGGKVHPILANAISGLRKVRIPGGMQTAMLFALTSPGIRNKENKTIEFTNLQVAYIGPINYETFKVTFLQSKLGCDVINKAYELDVEDEHFRAVTSKGVAVNIETWLARQWMSYEFSGYGLLGSKPVDVSHDVNEYCMAFVDDTKIVEGPVDAWDEFLSQVKNKALVPVFRAFIWACLDPTNDGRQVLYLYDPKGYTGKSRVVDAILKEIPQIAVAINAKSLENRFLISQLFGKRLVIYPDCKNTKILHYELIHSLTGGDPMPVEFKFQSCFSVRMYARCMIFSNDPPSVSRYRPHEMSRIIPIEIDASLCTSTKHKTADGDNIGDSTYVNRLSEQIWHFLYTCRHDYETLCPSRCDIVIPKNSFEHLSSDVEVEFEDVMQKFEVTKNYNDIIPASDVYNIFFEDYKNQRFTNTVKHELTVFLGAKEVKFERLYRNKMLRFYYTGIKEKVNFSEGFAGASDVTSDNLFTGA